MCELAEGTFNHTGWRVALFMRMSDTVVYNAAASVYERTNHEGEDSSGCDFGCWVRSFLILC